jgi:hypothetical protein
MVCSNNRHSSLSRQIIEKITFVFTKLKIKNVICQSAQLLKGVGINAYVFEEEPGELNLPIRKNKKNLQSNFFYLQIKLKIH